MNNDKIVLRKVAPQTLNATRQAFLVDVDKPGQRDQARGELVQCKKVIEPGLTS